MKVLYTVCVRRREIVTGMGHRGLDNCSVQTHHGKKLLQPLFCKGREVHVLLQSRENRSYKGATQ